MRSLSILLGVVALVACGCGKDESNPTAPNTDSRGTPIGAAGTFAVGTPLVWSAATGEIVGCRPVTLPTGGGLVAFHDVYGLTRVVDPMTAVGPVSSAAGRTVYYQVLHLTDFTIDSLEFRRVDLTTGVPVAISSCVGFCLHSYAISGDGMWLAWVEQASLFPSADSMVIENTVDGSRTRITPGVPVLMSPDGAQLLYGISLQVVPYYLYDRATGSSAPLDLGLPAGTLPAVLSWDSEGIHALFSVAGRELWVRHVTSGVTELLYTSSDTLLAWSGTWSADGSRVAMWGDATAGDPQTITRSLHVVDVAAKRGSVVASGPVSIGIVGPPLVDIAGAIVFSPDSRTVAYQFEDQLYRTRLPSSLARAPAPGSGTATHAGGAALRRATPATSAR